MKNKSLYLITGGAGVMTVGLFLLTYAVAIEGQGGSVLPTSSFAFSFGTLLLAGGLYLRTREIEAQLRPAKEAKKARHNQLRTHGLCPLCKENPALLKCEIHNSILCPNCLTSHDKGWCRYIPLSRRSSINIVANSH